MQNVPLGDIFGAPNIGSHPKETRKASFKRINNKMVFSSSRKTVVKKLPSDTPKFESRRSQYKSSKQKNVEVDSASRNLKTLEIRLRKLLQSEIRSVIKAIRDPRIDNFGGKSIANSFGDLQPSHSLDQDWFVFKKWKAQANFDW